MYKQNKIYIREYEQENEARIKISFYSSTILTYVYYTYSILSLRFNYLKLISYILESFCPSTMIQPIVSNPPRNHQKN